jgi:acyl-coenzyme A synthetase/AMP-(fatty) acid ligase
MEAAVIGVPSDLSDEEIKAFVVLRSGSPSELGAVRAFTAERLARFKVPRYLEVVRELPHTSTGRIAKHRLPRERTAAEEDFEPAAVPTDTLSDHPGQARRGRT